METEKSKREIRRTPWGLLLLLLLVMGLASLAFAGRSAPAASEPDCSSLQSDSSTSGCPEKSVNLDATLTRNAEAVILTRAVFTPVPIVLVATHVPPTATKIVPSATPTRGASSIVFASRIIALPQCDLKTMLDETHDSSQDQDHQVQALIDRLDEYYAQEGGTNNHIDKDTTLTGPAVFWMQFEGKIADADHITRLRSGTNQGVFFLDAGRYFVTTGEGGSIAMTVENDCPLPSEETKGS